MKKMIGMTDNDTGIEYEEKPTEVECNDIINKLKHNKAGGTDEIINELIKYGGDDLKHKIFKIMERVWESETIPKEWSTGMIIPIMKKVNPNICSNYRGISLLNTIIN